jgi:hypothetical protein
MAADNVLSGVFLEKDEGPISISSSYVCNQTSNRSAGGFTLRNSGYDTNFKAVTPGVSLTNSYIYNNNPTQIDVEGMAGGLTISDWETGKSYNLVTGNFTNTGNTIQGVGSGQTLLSDTYLNGSDWTDFQTTMFSGSNDWWNGDNTSGPFGVPVPNLGTSADLLTWQVDTLQDLTSIFAAPSGTPFSACTSITAPVKKGKKYLKNTAGIADFWLGVDNNSVSTDLTGTAVYNLAVTALNGFTGTVNFSLDGVSSIAGLSYTLSPSTITTSGSSVLTFATTVGTTPSGTYNITVVANSGSVTRTLTLQLVIVSLQLEFSTSTVTFPNTQKSKTGTSTVTITNKGSSSVSFTSYTVNNTVYNPTTFSIGSNTCPTTGKSLAGGASCTLTLNFSPTGAQTYSGANLTVVDADPSSPQAVGLTGTGTGIGLPSFSNYNLAFGSVLEHTTSAPMSVTLTNTGDGVLNVSKIDVEKGTYFADYSISNNNCIGAINVLASCSFQVSFTPSTLNTESGSNVYEYDDSSAGYHTLTVTGTGALPSATFSPTTLAFGNVQVGVPSTLSDTISNNSAVPLTITSVSMTGTNTTLYQLSHNCPTSPNTLAVGASCTATVTFTPNTSGALNSTLTVSGNMSGGSNNLNVTATGKYPVATFSPTTLAFGNVLAGGSSTLPDTITNTGLVPLTITSLALTGSNTKYYTFTHNCPISPNTLAVNATCTVTATFSPTTSGSLNSTLTVYGNMSGGSSNLSLTGTGKYPKITFNPGTLAFGNVQVGYPSTLSDTVTNTGVVPLTITSVALTGSNTKYYSFTHNCPLSPKTLAVNATCTATVTFAPGASGSLNSTLTFYDNASGGTSALSLTGTGKYPSASLTPSSYTFPSISVGSSESNTFTLTNTSTSTWVLNVNSIALTGSNAADFKYTTTCGASLAELASCTITVTFTPSLKATESATLTVYNNTSAGTSTSALTGTGK